MKTPFIKALLLAGLLAPSSFALSLYDTAPPIGLPESHAIMYSAYASMAWDDNINSSSEDEQSAMRYSFGVRASYSDQESADRIGYKVQLGGRLYDKAPEGNNQRLFCDSSLHADFSHTFSDQSVYTTSLNMSYRQDPDFANGISSAHDQGECFNWSWSHVYSRAIDTRWSWSINASYSGNTYTRGEYKTDDRQYVNAGGTLSYRASGLTTYSLSTTYRHDMRSHGLDSENIYLNAGISHALSPVSSVSATAGVQCKFIDGRQNFYPNIRLGYNRRIVEGLSVRFYASYDNENVNTYRAGNSYLSDQTLRVGTDLSYALTHKVTFNAGFSMLNSRYSKHTGNAADHTELTWCFNAGMGYKFTKNLSGSVDYRFTKASRRAGDYDRSVLSTGLTYNF